MPLFPLSSKNRGGCNRPQYLRVEIVPAGGSESGIESFRMLPKLGGRQRELIGGDLKFLDH